MLDSKFYFPSSSSGGNQKCHELFRVSSFTQKWLILNVKRIMSSQTKDYDITYKVLVIGETAVGKTSLIRSFSKPNESFTRSLLPTYGEQYR